MQKLRAERDRLLKEIEALKNQLIATERALAIVEGTEYRAADSRQRERSRNVKDTVLGMLAQAGPAGMSVVQVLDGAKAKGVELDRGTVSSLLSRLKRESTLDMRDGQYFVRPSQKASGEPPIAIH